MSILLDVLKDVFGSITTKGKTHENQESDLASSIASVEAKLNSGDLTSAETTCADLIKLYPANQELPELQLRIHVAIVQHMLPGQDYHAWLKWFQSRVKPENYLEIGVESGKSLQFAIPPTRAVGIDPSLQIVFGQETWVKLFRMTSDDFFAQRDARAVFGVGDVNLAFIDGLHTFDQALKDFLNIERFSTSKTIVLFHDTLPVIPLTAERERKSVFWTGDTWKVVLILSKMRPDLKIFTIPTAPSGLTVVTNLNPGSDVLKGNLDSVIQDTMGLELSSYATSLYEKLHVVANDFGAVARLLDLQPQ